MAAAGWLSTYGEPIPFGRHTAALLLVLPVSTGLEATLAATVGFLLRGEGAALAVTSGWLFVGGSPLVGSSPPPALAAVHRRRSSAAVGARLTGCSRRGLVLTGYIALLAAASLLAVSRRDVR